MVQHSLVLAEKQEAPKMRKIAASEGLSRSNLRLLEETHAAWRTARHLNRWRGGRGPWGEPREIYISQETICIVVDFLPHLFQMPLPMNYFFAGNVLFLPITCATLCWCLSSATTFGQRLATSSCRCPRSNDISWEQYSPEASTLGHLTSCCQALESCGDQTAYKGLLAHRQVPQRDDKIFEAK